MVVSCILKPGSRITAYFRTTADMLYRMIFSWETTNEVGNYLIWFKQFKWNKWVNIGEVMGSGTSVKLSVSSNTYEWSQ